MIKYGLISNVDADVLQRTLNLIMSEFSNDTDIYTCQLGVFDGETDRGINKFITRTGRRNFHTAIDNNKDKEVLLPFPECKMIIGNSTEVYNQLKDNSQHLILIDANHTFPSVVSDYYCYRSKLQKGGFLCFHDTSPQAQGKDWQRVGREDDTDMCISVRKALNEVGLLNDNFNISSYREYETISRFSFELVFDDFDINDRCGGICVFRKLY